MHYSEPRTSYFDEIEPAIDPDRLALANELEESCDWSAEPPAYLCTDDVPRVGEEQLAPSIWVGREFAVTTRGVEHRAGILSTIGYSRVWDDGLMRRMAENQLVDLRDLAEARRLARRIQLMLENTAMRH